MGEENFRTPLNESEKIELIKNLGNDPQQILQLETDIGKFPFQPQSATGNEIKAVGRSSLPEGFSGEAKLQFVYDHSRFETKVKFAALKGEIYLLVFSGSIFKLQRRQNFRTKLPPDWVSKVEIEQLADNTCKLEGIVLDLSLTGSFIEIQNLKNLATNMIVKGVLKISDFKEIKFSSQIKRFQYVGPKTYIGLEFQDLGLKGSEILHNITLLASKKMRDYTKA